MKNIRYHIDMKKAKQPFRKDIKTGRLIVWKKAVDVSMFGPDWHLPQPHILVKLAIPRTADAIMPKFDMFMKPNITKKCRASHAYVLGFYSDKKNGKVLSPKRHVISTYDPKFRYRVGKRVQPSGFGPSREVDCPGIHFFLTKSAAERYLKTTY